LSDFEEVGVTEAAEAGIGGGCDHVVAAISQPLGHLAADLLAEEQLHASAACSRFQAASASSAFGSLADFESLGAARDDHTRSHSH
jgi:hypothetical protein